MGDHSRPTRMPQSALTRGVLLLALQSLMVAALAPAAHCIGLQQFRRLRVVQDEPIAEMLVDSVAWLSDERGIIAGGWKQWPTDPQIIVAPMGAPAVRLERVGSPRFALSPSRREIAYWVATGGDWVQLGVAPVGGGQPRYLGPPRRVGPGMFLAWPEQDVIWALVQDGETCSALAISTLNGAAGSPVDVVGGQWLRLRHRPGSQPIAVWIGETRKCVLLDARGRSQELSPDYDYDRPNPSSEQYLYFDDSGALWMGGLPGALPTRLADQATAAAWLPDGSMLAYAGKDRLFGVWPPTAEKQRIAGSTIDATLRDGGVINGMCWAGDGGSLAYWRSQGATGQLRVADLGTFEVEVRVRFDTPVKPQTGQRVWVAKRLWRDKAGRVMEADWTSLKGEFAVSGWAADAPQVVTASSVGEMGGVVERIVAPQQVAAAIGLIKVGEEKVLEPVPGLVAWLAGTSTGGKVVGVVVRSRPLQPAQ